MLVPSNQNEDPIAVSSVRDDLTGRRFGRWSVLEHSQRVDSAGDRMYWSCQCDCGVTRDVQRSGLISGHSTSCGCLHKERVTKHGMIKTPTYKSWVAMVARCTDPFSSGFKDYGAKGITVCERWRNSFADFYEDIGERPIGCTIDRIDNKKGYEPGNCRWATGKQQGRNRTNNRIIDHDGRHLTLTEWSEITGLAINTIFTRLKSGWDVDRALTTPPLRRNTHTKRKETNRARAQS